MNKNMDIISAEITNFMLNEGLWSRKKPAPRWQESMRKGAYDSVYYLNKSLTDLERILAWLSPKWQEVYKATFQHNDWRDMAIKNVAYVYYEYKQIKDDVDNLTSF